MVRRPAVAGAFYPDDPATLRREVEALIGSERGSQRAVAILVPHAGYIYSGACAGRTYSETEIPDRVILIGPNHTGAGSPLAIMERGAWLTPLGEASIDEEIADALLARGAGLASDARAHAREHALEVQIPFLQVIRPGVRFAPIAVGTRRLEELLALGAAIAEVVRASAEPVLIVISSDMSHYIPLERARIEDRPALQAMEAVDPERLHAEVESRGISMCGYCPAVAGLAAARSLGARAGRLVAYTSSADASGDEASVVAYAGMTFA